MSLPIISVVIDCKDATRLAEFWTAVTGYEVAHSSDTFTILRHPERVRPHLFLQNVPEPRQGKNRVHFDLGATDLQAEVARLTELGGRVLASHSEEGTNWTVMADPEGNEFCVVQIQPRS